MFNFTEETVEPSSEVSLAVEDDPLANTMPRVKTLTDEITLAAASADTPTPAATVAAADIPVTPVTPTAPPVRIFLYMFFLPS